MLMISQEGCVFQTVSLFAWLLESSELETGLLFFLRVGTGLLDVNFSSTVTSCFFVVFQPLLMSL